MLLSFFSGTLLITILVTIGIILMPNENRLLPHFDWDEMILALPVFRFVFMLIFALILIPNAKMRLLTPTLSTIGKRFLTDQPLTSAGLFITAMVPLLLLAFASKYIMRGLQVGLSR